MCYTWLVADGWHGRSRRLRGELRLKDTVIQLELT
jgi:hypothetical protein